MGKDGFKKKASGEGDGGAENEKMAINSGVLTTNG